MIYMNGIDIPKPPLPESPVETIERFQKTIPPPDKLASDAMSDVSAQATKAVSDLERAPAEALGQVTKSLDEGRKEIQAIPGEVVGMVKSGASKIPENLVNTLFGPIKLVPSVLVNLPEYIETGVNESVDISAETDYTRKREKIRTLFDIIPF